MNISFKGRLSITNQASADALVKTAQRTDGLYRFLVSGDKLLLCLGNQVLAASPLSQPVFKVQIEDL